MEQIRHTLSGTPIAQTGSAAPLLPLHPADELADIRAQIARLRKREAELRGALLLCDDPDMRVGDAHKVVVKTLRSRVFEKSRLPQVIQSDPRFFRTREVTHVCLLPTERRARRQGLFSGLGLTPRPNEAEFDVLEPFAAILRET